MAFVALVSAAVRAAQPATLTLAARRTLFATPHFSVDKQTTEKKAAKRGRPPTNPTRQKQPEKEKQPRIPEKLRPPKRAPGSLQEIQQLAKQAAEIWRGYSMAEKQPFYDENEARKSQAKRARDEFFRNTSLSDLKQLNAIRTAQGKTKFHSTNKASIPMTPFISFSNEFRSSPDGQAIINETSSDKTYVVRAALAAAERWRSMSDEEKAPYLEKYKKAKEEMKVEQTES